MTTKWVTSNPPKASLIPVDTEPVPIGSSGTMQRYVTTRVGAWWARIVEPSGYTYWVRLINVE